MALYKALPKTKLFKQFDIDNTFFDELRVNIGAFDIRFSSTNIVTVNELVDAYQMISDLTNDITGDYLDLSRHEKVKFVEYIFDRIEGDWIVTLVDGDYIEVQEVLK